MRDLNRSSADFPRMGCQMVEVKRIADPKKISGEGDSASAIHTDVCLQEPRTMDVADSGELSRRRGKMRFAISLFPSRAVLIGRGKPSLEPMLARLCDDKPSNRTLVEDQLLERRGTFVLEDVGQAAAKQRRVCLRWGAISEHAVDLVEYAEERRASCRNL